MEAPAFGWDTGIANATPVGDSRREPHIAVSVTVFGLGQRASSKAELFGRGRSDKSRAAQARAVPVAGQEGWISNGEPLHLTVSELTAVELAETLQAQRLAIAAGLASSPAPSGCAKHMRAPPPLLQLDGAD